MVKDDPENKTAVLNVRVKPSIKAMAEKMAGEDRRSLAQWLELMIEAEDGRRTKKNPAR